MSTYSRAVFGVHIAYVNLSELNSWEKKSDVYYIGCIVS